MLCVNMAVASANISREEYLKRYLSSEDSSTSKKKIKKKKIKLSVPPKKPLGLKIIDNNIDVKPASEEEFEDEVGDDAPIVAAVIDERPKEIQMKEKYQSSHWTRGTWIEDIVHSKKMVSETPVRNGQNAPDTVQNRKKRNDSDSDCSPERVKSVTAQSSSSVESISKHRRRHDSSDSGNSHDASKSPFVSDTHKSDLALQPSQSGRVFCDSGDFMPPLHSRTDSSNLKTVMDSDGDLSPPRKQNFHASSTHADSDGDLSPPWQTSGSASVKESLKQSVRSSRQDSDSDQSPERLRNISTHSEKKEEVKFSVQRKHTSVRDGGEKTVSFGRSVTGKIAECISPPSGIKYSSSRIISESEKKTEKMSGRNTRPEVTLSGLKAGLQKSSALREETENLRRREKLHITQMSEELSGRNAKAVHRDKATGSKRDLESEKKKAEEEEKKLAEKQAKYTEWGKGLEQKSEQLKRLQNDIYEMSKPLARYRDDEDLDQLLKEQDREGDPMLEYMKKKKSKTQKEIEDLPKYKGPPAPPNRFGILPGYRWDGVDRSNGFERRYFEKLNSSKSKETEAHLWSVQDM